MYISPSDVQPHLSSSSSLAHAVLLHLHAISIYVSANLAAAPTANMTPHSPREKTSTSDDLADNNPFFEDTHTLNQSESQENASRLMDDLELLRAERLASREEREEATRPRSKSLHPHRHRPEAPPEDAFDTLTAQPQIPQTKPEGKPTVITKLFKSLRRFPRPIRYFVYVSTSRHSQCGSIDPSSLGYVLLKSHVV